MKTNINTFLYSICAASLLAWCAAAVPCQAHNGPWETNQAPEVQIVAPGHGAAFLAGTNISIVAWSENFTDALAGVEFYEGTNSLGVVTNFFTLGRGYGSPLAELVWTNPPMGSYTLTATAVDLAGNQAASAPVNISVVSDLPPTVKIVSPENRAYVIGPTNITLRAAANDPEGLLASVQFFQGSTSLGTVTSSTSVTNHDGRVQFLYTLPWSSVPLGNYTVTAVATDLTGDTATSAPVVLTVTNALPSRPHSGHH
jgi:hypothetical protein